MHIRVVTWNMNRRFSRGAIDDAWTLLDRINADITLLQEVTRPPQNLNAIWHGVPNETWGTSVIARSGYSLKEIPSSPLGHSLPPGHLERSHPGAWVAAEVEVPGTGLITAVSVYGILSKLRNGVSYAATSVHRSLSDLTPVLDVRRSAKPVLFAGDLNVSPPADDGVVARIQALGLRDCIGQRTKEQTDFVFASKKLELASCEPFDSPAVRALSEHYPLIAELDM